MSDKFPEIFKNKVDKLKSKVQNEFYYHSKDDVTLNEKPKEQPDKNVDKMTLLKKINNIFSRPDYVYQADSIILYKNGESMNKKVVGVKDNYLLTLEGEKIYIDEIYDIK